MNWQTMNIFSRLLVVKYLLLTFTFHELIRFIVIKVSNGELTITEVVSTAVVLGAIVKRKAMKHYDEFMKKWNKKDQSQTNVSE